VNIVFHAHHAAIPGPVQQRAERGVRKLGGRLRRAVDASVRFAADGPTRRVEIELRAPRAKALVASAEASTHEQALAEALARLEAQVEHLKDLRARRIRQAARAGAAGNGAAFAAADLAAVEDALLDLDDDAETEAT
jgi:ribosome-associated translation inhibitor RaiA